jgi:hypothetical protein
MQKKFCLIAVILLSSIFIQEKLAESSENPDSIQASDKKSYPYWPHQTFEWYYSSYQEPRWLQKDTGLELFKNAALAWEGCGPKLIFKGTVGNKTSPNDKMNMFGWAELKAPVRGFTYRAMKKNSTIIFESDIEINLNNLDIQSDPILLQKVITHEFGHALGLLHSETCDNVMSSASECGKKIAYPPPTSPTSDDWVQCKIRYH